MAKRRVIVEIRRETSEHEVSTEFIAGKTMAQFAPAFGNIEIDRSFPAVALPSGAGEEGSLDLPGISQSFMATELAVEEETYLVRGKVEDEDLPSLATAGEASGPVVGVFSDIPISPFITCGGTPVGTDSDVENLLCVSDFQSKGMTGKGVYVAIVDTGINMRYLNAHGKTPSFDKANSWVPRPGLIPGELPVDHGTMCAYDACIAAPNCTLLDIPVLLSTAPGGSVMEGLLSDAVRAYAHLRAFWKSVGRSKALVVNNSWGMFHPSWDFPIGHPGNYSDNLNHPFNRIVRTLERDGADILFAAGNCGDECPDGRCGGVVNAIYGANSHPRVLSVAGVDTHQNRVGYSTKGPGRLTKNKPDVACYTHFKGSEVYAPRPDGGTSAATPVAAGVVAAIRTLRPFQPHVPASWPEAIRTVLCKTAIHRGSPGYNFEYGWGIVNGCKLAESIADGSDSITQAESPACEPDLDQIDLSEYEPGGARHMSHNAAIANPADALRQVCGIYRKLRPVLQVILSFPLVAPKWKQAIKVFMGFMDGICPEKTQVATDGEAESSVYL